MSTNLIRITIPKNVKNLNQSNKLNLEQNTQNSKKKFLPPNSKSSKMDVKFNTKISRDNIENDKNFVNTNKNEVTKKLNFDKTIQPLPNKNIYQKVPNGRFPFLKDSNKKIVTKLSSNASRKDIEMKNHTNDSINFDDLNPNNSKKDKMDIDKKYFTHRNLSLNNSKYVNTRDTNNSLMDAEEKKNPLTTRNENINEDQDISLDIDDFITNVGIKIEETEKVYSNTKSVRLNKNYEVTNSSNGESLNHQNLKINLDNKPEFQTDEYRNLVSQFLKRDYSTVIVNNLLKEEEALEDCMMHHKITERMRMRMVDWMIEVLSNYKCDEHTFFLAVNLMDRYFKYIPHQLNPNDLHSIGIACMFIASKFYDVYPLRLKIVYEKIAHKKITCDEIKNQEGEIANVLNYIIGKPTIWEFLNYFIDELFYIKENNYNIVNKQLIEYMECNISESKESNSDFPIELYTDNMIKLLRLVVIYLAKMNSHDYSLVSKKPSLVASSTLFVALKICEQINKVSYVNDYFFRKITEISKKSYSEIIKCAQKILYNAQNFDSIFTGLDNLKKIHFNAIIEVKETR